MADQPEETLFLSVITLGEISEDVFQFPSGNRRKGLLNWIREEIQERFEGRILPVDDQIILRWAALRVQGRESGPLLPVMGGLISATADVNRLITASRNGSDFEGAGVPVLNPWIRHLHFVWKRRPFRVGIIPAGRGSIQGGVTTPECPLWWFTPPGGGCVTART